jgi:peptidylprolyl isomerase
VSRSAGAGGLRRRTLLSLLVTAPGAAALTSCRAPASESEPESVQVEVTGEVGRRPRVRFDAPLDITETSTETLARGDGVELVDGEAVMLAFLAVDASTGETIEDSYGEEPRILLLSEDEAGAIHTDLVGCTEGSRLLRLEPGTLTRPDPAVIVYDVLPTRAVGAELEIPEGLPQVTVGDDGAPQVEIPDGPPPTSLVVVPLIRGAGPQVRSGESITVRYVSVTWSDGEVQESTWGPSTVPSTIPFTGLIPGWQDGLVDATVGSRIMLVIPPEQAFGTGTVVFVVDVLALTTSTDRGDAG